MTVSTDVHGVGDHDEEDVEVEDDDVDVGVVEMVGVGVGVVEVVDCRDIVTGTIDGDGVVGVCRAINQYWLPNVYGTARRPCDR